ncbi:MAG: hypothetical protein ABR875_00485 [Minisyncoccia bacterium]|jgi:flagellar basal body-associated protein FliL
MANQQILDYVAQSRRSGINDGQIRQALLNSGWPESEISEALSSNVSTVNTPKKSKKGLVISIIVVLVIIIAAAGYFYWKSTGNKSPIAAVTNITNSPSVSPSSSLTPTVTSTPSTSTTTNASNTNIDAVKAILADMRQDISSGNGNLLLKYVSAKTANEISTSGGQLVPSGTSITVNNVFQSGANIVANITTTATNGAPTTADWVFISEGGSWKLDMDATLAYEENKTNPPQSTSNPNGSVNLSITSATVYPAHPIVNSPDVQITVTVKNTGTKISDSNTTLTAVLLGFTKEVPEQIGLVEPIAPGQTTTFEFTPYKHNSFFKISDTAGQKTIQISYLNKVIFTQTVEMNAN